MTDRTPIIDFLQKHIAIAPDRLNQYTTDQTGGILPQRWAFVKLQKHIRDFLEGTNENRWIVIPGLRGTGKTTLLAQLYHETLRGHKLTQQQLVYLPVDEVTKILQANLHDCFEAYEQLRTQPLETMTDRAIFFIDEIHYDTNWAAELKSVFDRSKRIMLICTGSSALALQTNTDAARRVQIEHMFPLSFPEYRMLKHRIFPIKGLKDRIKDALFEAEDAQDCHNKLKLLEKDVRNYWSTIKPYDFETYLTTGSIPFALTLQSQEQIFQRLRLVLDKIVYEDLSYAKSFDDKSRAFKPFDRETLNKAWKLLFLLANANVISYDNLSNDLQLSRPIVIHLLEAFEQAELLYPIRAEGSVPTQVRKSMKYTFLAPVIKAMLLFEVGRLQLKPETIGQLLEDAIAQYLYRLMTTQTSIRQITYDSAENGADFIVRTHKKTIIIEVGLGKKENGIAQVKNTLQKTSGHYGIVAADVPLTIEGNIIKIPKEFLLLM